MPEREEEEQGIENLCEQIMKENFPNLGKELDMQAQDTQRVSKKFDTQKFELREDPRRNTPRHIIITLSEIKDKGRILKTVREKDSYLQRSTHRTIS